MYALSSAQRLALAMGMVAFLVTCLYPPWKMQVWESRPVGSVDNFTWRPIEPPFNEYHLAFSPPHVDMSAGSTMVTELNIPILLIEWLGILLFTSGLLWLLKRG